MSDEASVMEGTLPVEDIKVPTERFGEGRTEHDDEMKDLMESISRYGILSPILLDEDNTLIAGERRLVAAKSIGRTHLAEHEYRYQEDLSQVDKRIIELHENVLRKDLSWAEEAKATREIHILKMEQEDDWSVDKTAALVGRSQRSTFDYLRAGEEMEEDEDLEEKDTLYGALREVKRKKKIQKRKRAVERKKKGRGPQLKAQILRGDARELITELNDESVDAIITNPPFGVDLTLGKEHREVYEDDEDYVTDLVRDLVPEMYRVLKPDSWAVIFWDIKKLTYNKHQREAIKWGDDTSGGMNPVFERAKGLRWWLEEAGFDYVTPVPAVWVKPNKTQGFVGDPDKGLIVSYEGFLLAAKGEAMLQKRGLQNIFVYDTPSSADRVHPLQMPVEFTKRLAELVCLGGETILDPFAGSGSIGLGALNRQCNFVGFELDKELAENGQMLLDEHVYSSTEGGD